MTMAFVVKRGIKKMFLPFGSFRSLISLESVYSFCEHNELNVLNEINGLKSISTELLFCLIESPVPAS
jgi:hypothetical protein